MQLAHIQKLIQPLVARVAGMIGVGVLDASDDTKEVQTLKVKTLAGDVRSGVAHHQPYGFTSRARRGAVVIYEALGGNRRNMVARAVGSPGRKKSLNEGEAAIWTDEGDYVLLKNGRIIEVVAGTRLHVTAPEVVMVASTKVRAETPLLEATAVVDAATSYKVGGTKVVGAQGAAIPNPSGGGTVDAQARATEVLILTALRTHGLIAP